MIRYALTVFLRDADQRIGVVGLGVATLAAYGREGDSYRFYEINPEVRTLCWTDDYANLLSILD